MNVIQSSFSRNSQSGKQRSEALSKQPRTRNGLGIRAEVGTNCRRNAGEKVDRSAWVMTEAFHRGGGTRESSLGRGQV